MGGCDWHGESRSWIREGTSSGGGGGDLEDSDPASARDCVPVDGKVPNDALDWAGGVVD